MQTLFLVPTRGRPDNALRLARAFQQTATENARLVFIVDDDDPRLDDYETAFNGSESDGLNFGYFVGPRLRLGPTLNEHAPRYAQGFEAIGFLGDDHVPQTQAWDAELARDVERTRGIAYGNDLIQGANLPTAVLMHFSIITTLGYMVPPGLTHMYLDNFWRDLGNALNALTYRADVIIQHVHPLAGVVAWDDGYTEVSGFMAPDEIVYREYQAKQFAIDVAKLQAART